MRLSTSPLLLGLAIVCSTVSSSASAPPFTLHSSHLLAAPSLPLGLYKHLKHKERTAPTHPAAPSHPDQLVFTTSDPTAAPTAQEQLAAKYPAHWFDQKVSHDPNVPPVEGNETFPNRYWFDAQFYKAGGPVFLLLAGETSGENRLPFLETGILNVLSKATGGIG